MSASARNRKDSQSPTVGTDSSPEIIAADSVPHSLTPNSAPKYREPEKSYSNTSSWPINPTIPVYGMANHEYPMGYYQFSGGSYGPAGMMADGGANPWAAGFGAYTTNHQAMGSPPNSNPYDMFGPPSATNYNPYGASVYDYVTNWSPSVVTHDARPQIARPLAPAQTDYFRTSGYGMAPEALGVDSYAGLSHQMGSMSLAGQPSQKMDSGFGAAQPQSPPKAQTWADKVKQANSGGPAKPKPKPPIGGLPGSRPRPSPVAAQPDAWMNAGTRGAGGVGRGAPIAAMTNARNGWTSNGAAVPDAVVNGDKTEASQEENNSVCKMDPGVLKLRKETNPPELTLPFKGARFFVIKSYSEDDVHRSIKYAIWCSTEHGNKRLDNAFKERESKGPVYLFFSVNASGHFCGVAQMVSAVDYGSKSEVWAQDKWKGLFKVRWLYVKDVPNSALRHIRLENNENKPVTNSRDTQEVPVDKGKLVMKTIHSYAHSTSLFDDFGHYEKRQAEDESQRKAQ